jgi:hypothetical protein
VARDARTTIPIHAIIELPNGTAGVATGLACPAIVEPQFPSIVDRAGAPCEGNCSMSYLRRSFCPSCGRVFDSVPKKEGSCIACGERFYVQSDGSIILEAEKIKAERENQRKAEERFPADGPCTRCAELVWRFISLSPNEKSATWMCQYCGKKKIVRTRTEIRKNPPGVRDAISKLVRRDVWVRDRGRCTECGSNEKLEYDHIIPHSRGGSNTTRNIQLLCERCNRKKQAKIG